MFIIITFILILLICFPLLTFQAKAKSTKPLIEITSVYVSPEELKPGDEFTVYVNYENKGGSGKAYIGASLYHPSLRYPCNTPKYCNLPWIEFEVSEGKIGHVEIHARVPEDAPSGPYMILVCSWDECWKGCENSPCYCDGCCDGKQHCYEEYAFEVTEKYSVTVKVKNNDDDTHLVGLYIDGKYKRDVTVDPGKTEIFGTYELEKGKHVFKITWYDYDTDEDYVKVKEVTISRDTTVTLEIERHTSYSVEILAESADAKCNEFHIVFNGKDYWTPAEANVKAGSYEISAKYPGGMLAMYDFHHWETGGNVYVSNKYSRTTTLTVEGDGWVKAIYGIRIFLYPIDTEGNVVGSITFNGKTYKDGYADPVLKGRYRIKANPPEGYRFVRWEYGDGLSVEDPSSQETYVYVSGYGVLKAVFEPEELHLQVNVHNIPGYPLPKAGGTIEVVLYNSNYRYIDKKEVSFSGGKSHKSVTFTELNAGEYIVEVYQTPNIGLKLREFWGANRIKVEAGETKIFNFFRHTQVFRGIQPKDINISLGQSITPKVTVKNFEPYGKETEIVLYIDKDRSYPYDYSRSSHYTILSQETYTFTLPSFTPEETGTYYYYIIVKGRYGPKGEYIVTDQCVWDRAIEVEGVNLWVDIYTDRGGQGFKQPAGSYNEGELVHLTVDVKLDGKPLVNVPVELQFFHEVKGVGTILCDSGTKTTDANGQVKHIMSPTTGLWYVVASVSYGESQKADTVTFEVIPIYIKEPPYSIVDNLTWDDTATPFDKVDAEIEYLKSDDGRAGFWTRAHTGFYGDCYASANIYFGDTWRFEGPSGKYNIHFKIWASARGEVRTTAPLGSGWARTATYVYATIADLTEGGKIIGSEALPLVSISMPSYTKIEEIGWGLTQSDLLTTSKLWAKKVGSKVGEKVVPVIGWILTALSVGKTIYEYENPTVMEFPNYVYDFSLKEINLTQGHEYIWILGVSSVSNARSIGLTVATSTNRVDLKLVHMRVVATSIDSTPPETTLVDYPSGIIAERDVTFRWSGSDDKTPTDELEYSYMLVGYDDDWSPWDRVTTKTYRGLPEKNYTFLVRARDSAGNVDPIPAGVSFAISTPPHAEGIAVEPGTIIPEDYQGSIRFKVYWKDDTTIARVKFKFWADSEHIGVKDPTGNELDSRGNGWYWYDMPRAEWERYADKAIYWCSVAWDSAGNRGETQILGPVIIRSPILKPDLTIERIGMVVYGKPAGSNPQEGDTVEFLVTIKNIGSASTSSGWYVDYYIDGVHRKRDGPAIAIGAGASVVSSFKWKVNVSTGTHELKVVVDPTNIIDEENEDNNEKTLPFVVLKIPNQPPIASFTYSPQNPVVSEEITFDASSSYDPDGKIVKYEWDFGDGSKAEGKIVKHIYTREGTYIVTLTVKDDDGLTDSTSKVIKIYNITPPPNITILIHLVANKKEVAPGEVFNMDIVVNGKDVKSVLVNFTYPDLVSVVDTKTYRIFDFMDTITQGTGYIRYLGVSTKNLDLSNNKVATITFKVSNTAKTGEIINFNVTVASINGTLVPSITDTIKIISEPWQKYDKDGNGKIDDSELLDAIMDWLNNKLNDLDLLNIIVKWLWS